MRKPLVLGLLGIAVLLATVIAASAATVPMKLDPTFAVNGRSIVDVAGDWHEDEPFTLIEQPDGKYVVPGKAYNRANGNFDFIVIRYNHDGNLDTSFDGDGKALIDIMGGYDEALGIALQTDGKLVAAGWGKNPANGNLEDLAVVRLNSNGSLDTSFDVDGRAIVDFNGGNDRAYGVVVLPDGDIVAGGFSTNAAGNNDFALARFNPDGSLEPAFVGGGKVQTDLFGSTDAITRMTLQSDGKIVGAGVTQNTTSGGLDFAFARYNQDGTLDTSFSVAGQPGVGNLDFLGSTDFALTVLQQPDSKILVGGLALNPGTNHYDFALVRLMPDGTLDQSFATYGRAGMVTTDFFGNYDQILSLAIQPDNKIIAAGHAKHPQRNFEFAMARYNPDGTLDNTFGVGGRLTTDFFGGPDGAHGIVLDPDGKAVLAGDTQNPSTGGDDFVLARYLVADPSFMSGVALKLPFAAYGSVGSRVSVLFSIYYANYDISQGNVTTAIDKLKTLRNHLLGCGGSPAAGDWILDCAAQIQMRLLTEQVIVKLGGTVP